MYPTFRRPCLWLCLFTIIVLTAPTAANAGPTELFFSEYVEGTSYNKALEIYNGTGAAINLNGYDIQMYFNGSLSALETISLTGILAADDVFIVANPSAEAALLALADMVSGFSNWYNGDDAIVLRKSGVIIDVIGQVGFDPGSEWGTGFTSTADNTLRRKPDIFAGDMIATNTFDPSLEWTGFATNTYDGIGSHTISGAVPEPLTAILLLFGIAALPPVQRVSGSRKHKRIGRVLN